MGVKRTKSLLSSGYRKDTCGTLNQQVSGQYPEGFMGVKRTKSLLSSGYRKDTCGTLNQQVSGQYPEGFMGVKRTKSLLSSGYRKDTCGTLNKEEIVEKERVLCFEFKKMHHIIIRTIHERLAACGFDEVTVLHGHILGYLYHNSDRDIYPRDIVKEYEIGKSSVTNVLQLMEEKGYLTRTPDKKDGRLKKIRLTKKGEEIHLQTIAVIDQLHKDMECGITKEEREVFFSIVNKMRQNAAKQKIEKEE